MLSEVLAPMLNRPADELRRHLPIGTPEECAARLSAWAAAGAQRVFLWPLAEEQQQLELFRERVLPLVRA
jgi:alkanesulfonate monooxygenase SsuD/methylene tetrahydromethanopterin reductase-like flavin-dependent oxidoreductase (luciferase family)